MGPTGGPGACAWGHDRGSWPQAHRPGKYVTIAQATGRRLETMPLAGVWGELGCNDRCIVDLPANTVVDVVEVVPQFPMKRLRGRIANPPGWISLINLENGCSWAVPVATSASVDGNAAKHQSAQGYQVPAMRAAVPVTCHQGYQPPVIPPAPAVMTHNKGYQPPVILPAQKRIPRKLSLTYMKEHDWPNWPKSESSDVIIDSLMWL
eukprot:gene11464-biopygen76380